MPSPPSINNPTTFTAILNTFQTESASKHVRHDAAKGLYTSPKASLTAVKAFFGDDSALKARETKRSSAFQNMRAAIDTEYGAGMADKVFKHIRLEGRDLSHGVTVADLHDIKDLIDHTLQGRQLMNVPGLEAYDTAPGMLDRQDLERDYDKAFDKPAFALRFGNEMLASVGNALPSITPQQIATALTPLLQQDPIDEAALAKTARDLIKAAALVDIPRSLNIAPAELSLKTLDRQFSEILGSNPPGTKKDLEDAVRLNKDKPQFVAKLAAELPVQLGMTSPLMDQVALKREIAELLKEDPYNQAKVQNAVQECYKTAALVEIPRSMNVNSMALGKSTLDQQFHEIVHKDPFPGKTALEDAVRLNVRLMSAAQGEIGPLLARFNVPTKDVDSQILGDLLVDVKRKNQGANDKELRTAVLNAAIMTASGRGDFTGIVSASKSLIAFYGTDAVAAEARGLNPLGTFMRAKEGKQMVDALFPYLARPAGQLVNGALNLTPPQDVAYRQTDVDKIVSGETKTNRTFAPNTTANQKAALAEADTITYMRAGLTAIYGGIDDASIKQKVASLPDEVCITLTTLHDEGLRVGRQGGEAFGQKMAKTIMNDAFILRYINPALTTAASTTTDSAKKQALLGLSMASQSVLNGIVPVAAGPGGKALVTEWQSVGTRFNDAILARGRALMAG